MDIFEEIRKRIEQKEFSKAKELIEKIEDKVERYNLLGIIHYYEGKIDEALMFFKKALDINPIHDDVLFNYSKVLFEKGEYFESWRYLTRINSKTWEVYDMLGDTQLKQNNPAMALHYYKKAMELSNIPEMKEKYQILKDQFKKDIKLAIFCLPGLDNFIKDIAQILSNIYDVKLVVTTDGKQIQEAYNWADIVWLEWANEMAVEITNKLPKDGKKIICRLHGYESLRKDLLSNIKWEKVDHVVFVAENVLKTSLENCSQLKFVPHSLIWNGIDLTKFTFKVRKPGYNLVFVGHFNYKKNPTLAVQILKKLTNIDSRYNISWAGQMQDERMWRYVNYVLKKMGIENRFKFDGFITNVNNYLESKNIFLSTSIHEGYGVAILEAMAKGIKPVIHNFYVAEEFYPREYIFNTIDEAIEMICSDDYDSTKYRDFVEQNCSLEKQIASILNIVQTQDNSRTKSKSIHKKSSTGNSFAKIWKEYNKLDSFTIMNDLPGKSLRSEFVSLLERFFILNKARILEVGTGTGAFSIELALREADVTGIDIDPASVELATRISKDYNIENAEFEVGDGLKLTESFKPQEFDIAFNMGVVEHFKDDDIIKMLKQMGEVAKFVVVGVPYSGSFVYKTAKETAQKLGAWEYGFERDFLTLEPLIKRAGLIPLHEEVIGVLAEPFYLRRINPEWVPLKIAENLQKYFQGEKVGSWLICFATKWPGYADEFLKLDDHKKIKFEGKQISLLTVPKPLVSIVIPVLNGANYVKRLVDNLKQIDHENLEIVLVDDGSTDGTADLFESLTKGEPKLREKVLIIRNKENVGTFHSRLMGVKHSQGSFVFFHDIDDLAYPKGVKKLLDDLLNFPNKKPLLTVANALMSGEQFNGEIWCSDFYKNIEELFVSEITSLSGKIPIIDTLIERIPLQKAYEELAKVLSKVGIIKMTIAEDTILANYLLLEHFVEKMIPTFYIFRGYEVGNLQSSSKKLLERIKQIPIHIAFLMVMSQKEKLFDKATLNQLENTVKQSAVRIYGQELGLKFFENYLEFKRRFSSILL
ncbi:glycosyl transferase family 2 [Thermotoga sp. Mc24]|uniref:glycosyltransferase n=1 Tax=Thermotoga sp. Mc24 TaxID=1231241 RepID=UPI000543854E|nr:glycosyltransferase [Thermotoga sp. Mc24]KHC90229.1 glycosyl transferase family 2 [Thermotoga sp. Mc24]